MRTGEHTNRELTATGFAKQDRTHDLETVALTRTLTLTLTLTRTLSLSLTLTLTLTRTVNQVAQRASQIEQLLKSGAKLLMSTEQDSNAAAFGQSSIEEILEHYSETTVRG